METMVFMFVFLLLLQPCIGGRPRTIAEFLAFSSSASGHANSSSPESAAPPAMPSAPLSTLAPPQRNPDASLTATTSAPPLAASLVPSPMETSVNSQQQQIAVRGPKKGKQQQIGVRGHNQGIREWNTGVKISVEFNEVFQPVGENAKPLKSQLGIIVCDAQRLPLTNLDWTSIDDSIKEGIWAEVQRNILNVPEGYRPICLKTCNSMWKDYKSKTKAKFFTPKRDDPKLASHPPTDVPPEHWVELIAYWGSSETQKQSLQNSMNQDKHGPSHITGRKSFVEVKYELQKSGQPFDKMSVWIKSRNANDPDIIAAIKDYNDLLSKEPEDQRELTSVKDKIFHQVIGPDGHGYYRTYGCSVFSRLVYPGPSTTPNSNDPTIGQQLQELAEHLSRQFDQKIQALRSEVLGTTRIADGTSAHSQAQTTSVQLKESIGDGVILVSPEKSGDTSTEEDDDIFSEDIERDSPAAR